MKAQDVALLFAIGVAVWMVGTIGMAIRGPAILEASRARYWLAFALSPVVSALLCAAILRWRNIPAPLWASGTLLLVIPGMIGESLALSHLPTFMPKLHASSGGRYGAFLFATYALVLLAAELVALSART